MGSRLSEGFKANSTTCCLCDLGDPLCLVFSPQNGTDNSPFCARSGGGQVDECGIVSTQ